jgi:hypothetical protein
VRIGLRERLIILVFAGLFVTMSLIGTYRYLNEERRMLAAARSQGVQSVKLMAELAIPYLLTSDFSGLQAMVQSFMHSPDSCEVTITDREGRQLVHAARPDQPRGRIEIDPQPIEFNAAPLGEVRIAVYPADMESRLSAYAVGTIIEHVAAQGARANAQGSDRPQGLHAARESGESR